MASKRKLPYLHRRSDTSGWFFIRRVPSDLREAVGLVTWRWLLAHDLATARLKLPEAVAHTDRVIAELRGDSQTTTSLSSSHRPIPRDLDTRLLHGRPDLIHELVSVGAPIPDHPELIAALPPEPIPLRVVTPEDLLDTATRLKTNASPQTRLGWVSCLKQFTDFLKHEQMQLVSREDAARYRDDMLKRLKVSTVKTRLNTLSGVFNIGVEEQLLPVNPFSGVGKRLHIEDKETKIYDISSVDALAAKKLPEDQYIVYQLLRYTGCRLAEILGIKTSDIDLPAGVIHITAHPDRPLKTKESKRVVPIHDNIRSLLERLVEGTERPFSRFYKESTQRWGGGIAWSSLINIHPHGLRHHAVSSMRAAGISERVIAKVVGHSVPGMTGQYGTVAIELLQEAVRAIA